MARAVAPENTMPRENRLHQLAESVFLLALAGLVLSAIPYAAPAFFTNDKWASWLQAIGSLAAVVVALFVVLMQREQVRKDAVIADASVLLSLQVMAHQLGQMSTLGPFQKLDAEQRVIYADTAVEFGVIAKMLSEMPMAVLATHGHLETAIDLRRAAMKMQSIFEEGRDLQGEQFWSRYCDRLTTEGTFCRGRAAELDRQVTAMAPSIADAAVRHL